MSARGNRWLPGVDEAAERPLPRPDESLHQRLAPEPSSSEPAPGLPLPWALPACAEWLRSVSPSLGRLPVGARIAGLARVARSWLDPDEPLRREAVEVLPGETGLSREMVEWGLDRAFEVIGQAQLRAWWDREGRVDQRPEPRLSGHVWAGNVFVAGLPPLVASVLAGVPALVKAPSGSPSFAALFARSVAVHAPELGPCIGAAAWSREDARATRALLSCVDVLFAFGDDPSIDSLSALAPPELRLHGFGHRVSVGLLPGDAPVDDAVLRGLAVDSLAWDGAGCLSPRWLFVEGPPERALALARATARLLPEVAEFLPGCPLSPEQGAERASWLAQAAFAGWSDFGAGWGVAALPGTQLSPAPPPRVLCFVPIADLAGLRGLLEPLAARLQGATLAPGSERSARLESELLELGLSRVAAPGSLQRPPVDWNHDDVAILAALC